MGKLSLQSPVELGSGISSTPDVMVIPPSVGQLELGNDTSSTLKSLGYTAITQWSDQKASLVQEVSGNVGYACTYIRKQTQISIFLRRFVKRFFILFYVLVHVS
jgi:hypothetical protein